MVTLLRLFFWPLILLTISVLSWVFQLDVWGFIGRWLVRDPLEAVLSILGFVLAVKLVVRWSRFTYAYLMSGRLVSMKVLLPRSDSKIDQEKRTEKDFKEKVAVMEQLYRALWEVKALTFWQLVHFWMFRYATISF
ncbi:hypothetical protein HYZ99_04285, partial [Candidatus Peregrinibacteria bacterium]|nr:hypothetical protein [Candidatus Peregrinibacteria bacterium]